MSTSFENLDEYYFPQPRKSVADRLNPDILAANFLSAIIESAQTGDQSAINDYDRRLAYLAHEYSIGDKYLMGALHQRSFVAFNDRDAGEKLVPPTTSVFILKLMVVADEIDIDDLSRFFKSPEV